MIYRSALVDTSLGPGLGPLDLILPTVQQANYWVCYRTNNDSVPLKVLTTAPIRQMQLYKSAHYKSCMGLVYYCKSAHRRYVNQILHGISLAVVSGLICDRVSENTRFVLFFTTIFHILA